MKQKQAPPQTKIQILDARVMQQGAAAYNAGKGYGANPFHEGSTRWASWLQGWGAAWRGELEDGGVCGIAIIIEEPEV